MRHRCPQFDKSTTAGPSRSDPAHCHRSRPVKNCAASPAAGGPSASQFRSPPNLSGDRAGGALSAIAPMTGPRICAAAASTQRAGLHFISITCPPGKPATDIAQLGWRGDRPGRAVTRNRAQQRACGALGALPTLRAAPAPSGAMKYQIRR